MEFQSHIKAFSNIILLILKVIKMIKRKKLQDLDPSQIDLIVVQTNQKRKKIKIKITVMNNY
jgi:hypothetical protein